MSTNETIAALYTAHGARLYRYTVMLLADLSRRRCGAQYRRPMSASAWKD